MPGLVADSLCVVALSVVAGVAFAQEADRPLMEVPASVLVEVPVSALVTAAEVDSDAERRGVVRTATIRLPADLFEEPPPPGEPRTVVRIPTDEDSYVELVEVRRISRDGRTVVYGRDRTQENAQFAFTRRGGSIWRGEIERDDELITFTGPREVDGDIEFRLVVWRPSAFPEERSPNEARAPSRRDESGGSDESSVPETGQIDEPEIPDEPEESIDPIEIEILVVYTAEAAAKAPSETFEDIEITIGEIVWAASQRMQDQAGIKLNVHIEPVSYVETGDMAIDLERLECPCDHKKKGVGDNHLNEVFDLWEQTEADVVSLWIHSETESGYGNIMRSVGTDWAPRAAHVVAWDAAIVDKSFDHELGHQFGARHNWEKDDTIAAPYLYNHGYLNIAATQVTIMAYRSTCSYYGVTCTRAGIWSDPGYPLGGPWGVAAPGPLAADNALTLESSAPTVALFNTRQDLVGCCIKEGGFFFKTYRPGQCP